MNDTTSCLHGEKHMILVDAYQNWRSVECPWCRIAQLEAALVEAMDWDWLTDPDGIMPEVVARLEALVPRPAL